MNWDQIESKWAAMARRVRPDRQGPASRAEHPAGLGTSGAGLPAAFASDTAEPQSALTAQSALHRAE